MTSPATVRELREVFKEREWEVEDTHGKGIHVTVPNSHRISIQWGPGNYCANKDLTVDYRASYPDSYLESPDAEVRVTDLKTDKHVRFEGWTDEIRGWMLVEDILALADYLADGTLIERKLTGG